MCCCDGQSLEKESQVSSEAVNTSTSTPGSTSSSSHSQHHAAEFYVAKLDFAYVDTPLLVVIWVLFTAAAKIGQQLTALSLTYVSQ